MITKNLVIGLGIGNSSLELGSYLGAWKYDWISIHNPILAILSETGLIGLMLYMSVLISTLWLFIQNRPNMQKRNAEWLKLYWPLVCATAIAFIPSWFKSGGGETDIGLFLVVSLLLLPGNVYEPKVKDL
jgi:O-antigen ligase